MTPPLDTSAIRAIRIQEIRAYHAKIHAAGRGPVCRPHMVAQYDRHVAALLDENRKLRLKAQLVDRLPFCPDHRDKVQGKPCRECEIERLEGVVEKAREALLQAIPWVDAHCVIIPEGHVCSDPSSACDCECMAAAWDERLLLQLRLAAEATAKGAKP